MSSKNALAFAVGLGNGYMAAGRQKKSDERQAKDDEWRDEQRQYQRDQQATERETKLSLADAVAPRAAIQGTAVDTPAGLTLYKDPAQAQAAAGEAKIEAEMRGSPSLADVRPAYGITGTSRGNQITTDKPDLVGLNSMDARMGRVVDATMRTDPSKALVLQNAALSGKKVQMDMDEMTRLRRKAIEDEGMVKTVQASRSGDVNAVTQAFNAQGDWQIDGDLKVTPEKRKAPWGGEVDTFTYTGTIKGPDGQTKPVRLNSLEAMTAMIPFKDMFKIEADIGKGRAGLENSIALEGVRTNNTMREIGARGGQDRSTIDHRARVESRSGGAGKPPAGYRWNADGTAQERIPGGPADKSEFGAMDRVVISGQLRDARGSLKEIDEELNSEMKPWYLGMKLKPGSPEEKEHQALLAKRKVAQDEVDEWSRTLKQAASVSRDKVNPSPSSASAKPGGYGTEAGLRDVASGNMGGDPAAMRREIAASKVDLGKVTDAPSKKMLTDYIANLERQLANVGGYGTEAGLRDVASGNTGGDPAAMRREIAASKADLWKVTDAPSKKMLTDHIANLERQLANVGGERAPAGAAALTKLPAGSKQIGTSGGRPVFETPDGKRFIQ